MDNPYFYETGTSKVEYEGYFVPLSCNEIEQDINLNITELATTKEGQLFALELDQLEPTNDPLDEISMGRRYLGYFYVTDKVIYHRAVQSFDGFTDKLNEEIIKLLQNDEKAFFETCEIVCCEEGTADIADENGYHSYVEVSGKQWKKPETILMKKALTLSCISGEWNIDGE